MSSRGPFTDQLADDGGEPTLDVRQLIGAQILFYPDAPSICLRIFATIWGEAERSRIELDMDPSTARRVRDAIDLMLAGLPDRGEGDTADD